jgi:phi13 family phage major tail protein
MTQVNSAVTNIKKLVYAIMTDEATETYGAVKAAPPMRSLKIDAKSEMAKLYCDGVVVEAASALGDIGVDVETQDVPLEIQADWLGHTLDSANGVLTYNENDKAPYLALGYQRVKANGKNRYVWLYKVKFSEIAEEGKSKEGGKVEFQTPKISGIGVANKNGDWKKVADDDTKGSAISGYLDTIPTSTPFDAVAPTVTTVPLDAATGVAVAANIVFTFSKAINPADVTNGNFILMKANVPVACTLSLGTNNTVVTMDPNSNMSAGTYVAICSVDVRSASGVPLAAAKVISFTV